MLTADQHAPLVRENSTENASRFGKSDASDPLAAARLKYGHLYLKLWCDFYRDWSYHSLATLVSVAAACKPFPFPEVCKIDLTL